MLSKAVEIYSNKGPAALLQRTFRAFSTPFVQSIIYPLCTWKFDLEHDQPVDVIEEDWDTLIILDACRYDSFKQVCDLPGELESRISSGTMSWEFMKENFVGRGLHDTVYVTANPFVHQLDSDIFHAVDDSPLLEGWDDERETVPPEAVTSAAIRANQKFPHKRLIIHYMQPHLPPIGSVAAEINKKVNLSGFQRTNHSDSPSGTDGISLWAAAVRGIVDQDLINDAYIESLDLVLEEASKLCERLDGKAVISSDHGEHLGERPCGIPPRTYGHDNLPRTESLCVVPWFECMNFSNRRQITTDDPVSTQNIDAEIAEERLKQLGYRT